MPAPTSVNELLELTQKSGTVDDGRLSAYIDQLRSSNTLPIEPNKLAGLMVRDGLLTFFQAEQLLLGKWKRFTIGKYRVLERLGSGGMGQVFLCEHKLMRRRVAVKVLPTAKADDPSSLERFYREARAVAALDHPNIVRAYDIDQDDNLHFLVMEYVDGASLQDIVKKFGPMDPLRACHYIYQAAHGLQHAYDQARLVHRDIKPGNILVDRTGVVKILDMGLARFFHDEEDLLTKKYDESVLGTADYLAPEQAIDSHGVDIRADIYSLGATFYFMLTGQPPFTEGTVAQKLIWHQTKDPKSLVQIRPDVPREIVGIVSKMMLKDMNQRPQLPNDVAAMLAPLVAKPIPAPPDAEMPRLSPAVIGVNSMLPTNGPPSRPSAPMSAAPSSRPSPVSEPITPPAPTQTNAPSPTIPKAPAPDPPTTPIAPASRPNAAPNPKTQPRATPSAPRMPARMPQAPIIPSPAAAAVAASVAPQPQPSNDSSALWAAVTTDTPNPKAHDTLKSPVYKPPTATHPALTSHRMRGVAAAPSGMRWVILIAAGALIAVVCIAGAFALGLFKKKDGGQGQAPEAPAGQQTLIVETGAPASQVNTFRFVAQALRKAKNGDRILVRGTVVEEQWSNVSWGQIAKGITIEPDLPAGRYMPWRLPANAKSVNAVLELEKADGLTFRRFAFDGQNSARAGIYLTSRCPGVTFEDIQILNCPEAAIKLNNTVGDADRPVRFTRVRVVGGRAPNHSVLSLLANPKVVDPANENIVIQDCQFEGPTNAFIVINGSIQNVTIQFNRFSNAAVGIVLKKPTENQWYQMRLHGNTFNDVSQYAIGLEGLPITDQAPPAQPGNRFVITNNYFANCKTVLNVPEGRLWPDATIKGNARDAASADGNGRIDLRVVDYKFINLDPNSDGFLRYPKDAPLANLPDGPVGVPPGE